MHSHRVDAFRNCGVGARSRFKRVSQARARSCERFLKLRVRIVLPRAPVCACCGMRAPASKLQRSAFAPPAVAAE
eukprot:3835855-Lingulodinium_polyedra.AAC.1